jgi:hypothetical protein
VGPGHLALGRPGRAGQRVLLRHGWDGRTVARIANRLSASGPVQARAIATEFADVYVGYRPGDRLTLHEAERRDRAQQ